MTGIEAFIDKLEAVFGPRRPGFFEELRRRAPDTLTHELGEAAAATIIGSGARAWPSIRTCTDELRRLAELQTRPPHLTLVYSRRDEERQRKEDEWSHYSTMTADRLVAGKLGQRAANEGWVVGLWDFCRKEHRLPHGSEVSEVIAKSRAAREKIEQAGFSLPHVTKAYHDRVSRLVEITENIPPFMPAEAAQ
jgi:hypothetical protein